MAHCCSQCSFTAQFESALTMHHQLHHEGSGFPRDSLKTVLKEKSNTVPRMSTFDIGLGAEEKNIGLNLTRRTSSATRLFDKLRSKLCKSKQALSAHPEEVSAYNNEFSVASDCTSKALKVDSMMSRHSNVMESARESFGCHLCSFVADRITVLDRHLLNDHQIGLDNLLKLVMAKTKDGLNENQEPSMFSLDRPYYRPANDMSQDGEYIVQTVTPKIKIVKHAAVNTDLKWTDIPDLKHNCREITKEFEKMMTESPRAGQMKDDKNALLSKMATLNECMCKFVDSSNTLKKVLNKEFTAKSKSVREFRTDAAEPFFDLGLGDQETPREWEKAISENLERPRRGPDKKLNVADCFFF